MVLDEEEDRFDRTVRGAEYIKDCEFIMNKTMMGICILIYGTMQQIFRIYKKRHRIIIA